MQTIWVARLWISPRTRDKLINKHGIDSDELRREIVAVAGLPFVWDDHPERGRRAILKIVLNGRRTLVVLYPVASGYEDEYNLGSAYHY